MLQSIRHGLSGLARFSGRDQPSTFWPYVAFVVLLIIVGSSAIMIPEIAGSFAKLEQFAAANPDKVTVQRSGASVSYVVHGDYPELAPDFSALLVRMGWAIASSVALLAAAVSRRLHDSGLRAYWGLMPLPFLAFGCVGMELLLRDFSKPAGPDMRLFLALFLNNMIYLATLALLAWLLARASGTANRFGKNPAT